MILFYMLNNVVVFVFSYSYQSKFTTVLNFSLLIFLVIPKSVKQYFAEKPYIHSMSKLGHGKADRSVLFELQNCIKAGFVTCLGYYK